MPVQLCSTDSQQADLNEHIIVDVVLNFNNQQVKSFAMIDSGSMANFCDSNFAIKNHLPLCTKANPIEIITVDGSPISSGKINQTTTLRMDIGPHLETSITMNITKLGQYPIILGIPWLKQHDPSIKWSTYTIVFDSNICKKNAATTSIQSLHCQSIQNLTTLISSIVKSVNLTNLTMLLQS